jgi:hypothetical protein
MKSFIYVSLFILSILFFSCQRPKATTEEVEGRDLVNRWLTAINETKSVDVFGDYLATDYIWHLPSNDVYGLENVKKGFADAFSRSNDFHLRADDIIVAGGKVVVRWTISGTFKTSGKKWINSSITIDRFSGGKFLEGWEIGSDKPWVKLTPTDSVKN